MPPCKIFDGIYDRSEKIYKGFFYISGKFYKKNVYFSMKLPTRCLQLPQHAPFRQRKRRHRFFELPICLIYLTVDVIYPECVNTL